MVLIIVLPVEILLRPSMRNQTHYFWFYEYFLTSHDYLGSIIAIVCAIVLEFDVSHDQFCYRAAAADIYANYFIIAN